MPILFSNFLKDASLSTSPYDETLNYLVEEEDNDKKIEEEKRKLAELRQTEEDKLKTMQISLEEDKPETVPSSTFSSFLDNASNVEIDSTLDTISTRRKMQYGFKQEPMIAGSIWRLGKGRLQSLFTDETFDEAAQRIEKARQEKIFEEFPEFYGVQEGLDPSILSGRIGAGLADPATLAISFILPWAKIAQTGKIATVATGASLAAGETILREKALYGEVSPSMVGLSAVIGGGSAQLGSVIASKLGGKGTRHTLNNIDENGNTIRTDILDRSASPVTALNDDTVDALNIISRELAVENPGNVIRNITNNVESAGVLYQKVDLIRKEIINIKDILSPHLQQMKKINKNHIVVDATNKIVFKPSKIISRSEGKKLINQLNKNNEELSKVRTQLNEINIVKQPNDVAILGVESLHKAYKKGLLKGKIGDSLTRALVQEITRPLIGATAGGLVGIYLTEYEDYDNQALYYSMALGTFAGLLSKRLELSKYKLPARTKKVANDELEYIFKADMFSRMKRFLATSHASKLTSSGNPILQKFGLEFFRTQGATLRTGQVLEDSVESLSDSSFEFFKKSLFDIIGSADDNTILAAGRILQQRNMPSNAKYSFLQTGDLENVEAKLLADNLFKLNVGFKDYMKKAGISFTEQDSYGLTQILDRTVLENLGHSEAVKVFTKAFQLQAKNNKGKIIPGFSKVDETTKNLLPIEELTTKQAEKLAIKYIQSADNLRRQLVLDADKLLEEKNLSAFIKTNGQPINQNETVVHSARFFENERVLFDQEARALAKEFFVQDPISTNLSLFDNSVKVAEFARRYGAKGQGIQDLKKQLKTYYKTIDKKGIQNPYLQKLYNQDIKDISDSVNAYFKVYDANMVKFSSDAARTGILALQTLMATTSLTKVAIPSLGDILQTIQNSGVKAAFKSSLNRIKKGKTGRFADELALYSEQQSRVWGKRKYNGALERELSNFTLDANTNTQRRLVEFQRIFFEAIQLGRITRFARAFAYDAGAFRVFDLSKKISTPGTKLTRPELRQLNFLGLDEDAARFLGRFKNIDEAYENSIGKKLIDRAGRRSADRDALIPQVGNRRLFSQSKNPFMKLAGSFLSWAQAKGAQTNALIRRIEEGEGKLALMMLATLPIYAAVRDIYVAINPNKEFREEHGKFTQSIKEKDLQMFTEAIADSAIFTGQLMPWYIDKIVNATKFGTTDAIETVYPIAGFINDVAKIPTTEGARSKGVVLVEEVIPFGKDITRSEVIGELVTDEEDITLKELAKLKDEEAKIIPKPFSQGGPVRQQYFEGEKVSKDFPVTDVKETAADRVDPFTGQPYSDQMKELGL